MTQPPDTDPNVDPHASRQQLRDIATLRRPRDHRMVAGVCEGLSRHFDVDPIVVRVVFAALTIFGGSGLVFYVLAWLTIPAEGEYDSIVSGRLRRDPERVLVAGLSIAAVAAVVTMIGAIGVSAPNPFPAVVVGLAALTVFALFTRRPSDSPSPPSTATPSTAESPSSAPPPPPSPPRRPRERPRLLGLTLAVIAIAVGVVWVLDETVVGQMQPSVYPVTALGIIAAALLMGTWYGRSRFLILLGLIASAATLVTVVIGPGPYGERIYRPATADAVRSTYQHGAGRIVVHLENVADVRALDGRTLTVDSSVGQVEVIVPSSVDATIHAHVRGGEIRGATATNRLGDGEEEASITPVDTPAPDVTIDIDLRYGQIDLMRLHCPGDTGNPATTGLDRTYEPTGGTRVPAACN